MKRRSLIAPVLSLAALAVSAMAQLPTQAPAYPESQPAGCRGCLPETQGGVGPAVALPNGPAILLYDLLLKNGHVIDPKNGVDRITDVALKDGKIAAVGDNLKASDAIKTIDATGYYVTPGLIDMHVHVYVATGERGVLPKEETNVAPRPTVHSFWPDDFSPRNGITTIVDAGSSGWRTFEDFKEHVIDRSQTRVLAFLNIVGIGQRGVNYEDDLADMQAEPAVAMAKRYPDVIVGIKSAHFTGPEWEPYIQAVKAGNAIQKPVMIDYGSNRIERPLLGLLSTYLRPGDIYTHVYSGLRGEQDTMTLKPSQALLTGRRRGIYFDTGTGSASFRFRVAVPLIRAGFKPDSISTDTNLDALKDNTKDLLNVMDKFMAMGLTLQEVIADVTSNPAREMKHEELGNLSVGSIADVAVLSEKHGNFGFIDAEHRKIPGDTRLVCQLTIHNGRVVYDLNGISMDMWDQPASSDVRQFNRWTTYRPRPALPSQLHPEQN